MNRGNMTRRLVMGLMAVAVCLGTGIAMAGSTAAAPVASAAPGSVHRTRPASNTDGCEGKFSALTRGGDVYSYKSVNDNRGQMTGAAENFTQKGEKPTRITGSASASSSAAVPTRRSASMAAPTAVRGRPMR